MTSACRTVQLCCFSPDRTTAKVFWCPLSRKEKMTRVSGHWLLLYKLATRADLGKCFVVQVNCLSGAHLIRILYCIMAFKVSKISFFLTKSESSVTQLQYQVAKSVCWLRKKEQSDIQFGFFSIFECLISDHIFFHYHQPVREYLLSSLFCDFFSIPSVLFVFPCPRMINTRWLKLDAYVQILNTHFRWTVFALFKTTFL